jgi:hypothetical protein
MPGGIAGIVPIMAGIVGIIPPGMAGMVGIMPPGIAGIVPIMAGMVGIIPPAVIIPFIAVKMPFVSPGGHIPGRLILLGGIIPPGIVAGIVACWADRAELPLTPPKTKIAATNTTALSFKKVCLFTDVSPREIVRQLNIRLNCVKMILKFQKSSTLFVGGLWLYRSFSLFSLQIP